MRIRKHIFCMVLLVSAVWLSYRQSLQFDFVWDDTALICDNSDIRSLANVPDTFMRSFWSVEGNRDDPHRNFYRPVIMISYITDYSIWGLNPEGYHLTNIMAHCLCVLGVYILAFVILQNLPLAFLAAILFGVHPVHVENVCWISGRTDIFCALFLVLTLICTHLWLQRKAPRPLWLAGILIFYILSLFSKEVAVMLPALILFWCLLKCSGDSEWKRCAALLTVVFIITILYLLTRTVILSGRGELGLFNQWWDKAVLVPIAFSRYLGLMFCLHQLDPHHATENVSRNWVPAFFVALPVIVGYAMAFMWALRQKHQYAIFGLGWFFITLIPVFNIGVFGDVFYADRFLYIPSIGFAIAAAGSALLPEWKNVLPSTAIRTTVIAIISTTVVFLLAVTGWPYSLHWQNSVALFSRAIQTSNHSSHIAYNLAIALQDQGQHVSAIEYFLRAIELNPKNGAAHTSLGISLNKLGKQKEAVRLFQMAGAMETHKDILFYNMGDTYRALGDISMARQCYLRSIAFGETAEAHNDLGETYLTAGEYQLARKHLAASIRIKPLSHAYNNLGYLALKTGSYADAAGFLNNALAFPANQIPVQNEIVIRYNLAGAYAGQGESVKACEQAAKVLDLTSSIKELPENTRRMAMEMQTLIDKSR